MKRSLIALAIVACSGALVLPASAGLAETEQEKSVSLAGIDLNTEAGAEIVYTRIVKAADRVCDVNRGFASLKEIQPAKTCAKNAVDAAVKALDAEKVTALHAAG